MIEQLGKSGSGTLIDIYVLTVINPPTRSLVCGSSSFVPSCGEYNSVVLKISKTRSKASATGMGLLSCAALMMFIT